MPNLTSQMEAVCRRFEELSIRLNQPETAADPAQFRRLMQEYHEAQPVVDAYHALTTAQDHLAQAKALLEGDEPLDADFKAMVQQELSEKSQDVAELENNLKILLLPKDANDEKSVIMEIRAGAGGEEAALFAHSLVRIDTFRSSGAGGQHINKTSSAIRVTHIPTGTVVECQNERSQFQNKDKALEILRSRLLAQKQKEQQDAINADRAGQVGTGDRSEKIRTYNFPQDRCTDHRIGLTVHNLDKIMDGNLDDIIDALATREQAERLQKLNA